MKIMPEGLLYRRGWKRLDVDSSLPSYCPSCGRQRIHYVVGFAKRNGRTLVKLACEHDILEQKFCEVGYEGLQKM